MPREQDETAFGGSDSARPRGFAKTKVFSHSLAYYDSNFGGGDEKPRSYLWIWAAAFCLAIALVPSLKIARIVRTAAPISLPSVLPAGLPISIADSKGEIESVDLDGEPLRRLAQRGDYLGAVSLDKRGSSAVSGMMTYRKRPFEDGPTGWIYSSPLREFAQVIQVVDPNTKSLGPVEVRSVSAENPRYRRSPAAIREETQGLSRLSAIDELRRSQEQTTVAKILERIDGDLDFGCWQAPYAESKPASASRARLRRGHRQHLQALRTELKAVGSGHLALAADLVSSGKTVLIYHGAGLFTKYSRLSEFDRATAASPGSDVVAKGQRLGFSASREPDFEMIWHGKPVDAAAFLDLSRQMCARAD